MLTPRLSSAVITNGPHDFLIGYNLRLTYFDKAVADTATTKKAKQQQEADDKKKIKEIAKARRQPKPEKIDVNSSKKPKRQRRPQGLEEPPEIPRRNGGG
jgi:hypothetical protein